MIRKSRTTDIIRLRAKLFDCQVGQLFLFGKIKLNY